MQYLAALLVGAFVGVAIVLGLRRLKIRASNADPQERTDHKKPSLQQKDDDENALAQRQKLVDLNRRMNDEWAREAGFGMDPEEWADRQMANMASRRPAESKRGYYPPVILLPESRTKVDISTDGNSWFGGLPHLADAMWPRSRDGSLMHPAAQIDLAELAAANTPEGLPKTGSLAFFVDLTSWPYDGAVVYVSEPSGPTTPIAKLPRLFRPHDGDRYGIEGYTKENAPRLFPRWPITFVPLADIKNADEEAQVRDKVLGTRFPKCHDAFYLTASAYKDTLPALSDPTHWDTAQRFANLLTNSRATIVEAIKFRRDSFDHLSRQIDQDPDNTAKVQHDRLAQLGKDLEYLTANIETFAALETETVAWAYAHDRWDPMYDHDVTQLNAYISLVHKPFGDETSGLHLFMSQNAYLRRFVDQTLKTKVQSTDAVYNTLPQQFRDDIDSMGRFARGGLWHQMFGASHTVHEEENHQNDYLLLKLGLDHVQDWEWGEESACFWIAPDDLRNQRWGNVTVVIGQQ